MASPRSRQRARTAGAARVFDAVEALAAAGGRLTLSALPRPPTSRLAVDVLGLTFGDGAQVVPLLARSATSAELSNARTTPLDRDDLNSGKTVTVPSRPTRALPLGAKAWAAIFPPGSPAVRVRAILEPPGMPAHGPRDPRSKRSPPSDRSTISRGAMERAAAFAAMSGGLRIREGAVVPPGGPEAAALWESAVGERLSDPGAFIRRLYGRDGGRVAYLFDAIASLEPARQRFALGLRMGDPDERREGFRRLAAIFVGADDSWRIRSTPFSRPSIDPGLLHLVTVTDDGALPWARHGVRARCWRHPVARRRGERRCGRRIDGRAWLVARVLDPPIVTRRDRLERLLFASRMFARGTRDLTAVRRRARVRAFPSLMLTLERLRLATRRLCEARAPRRVDRRGRRRARRHRARAVSRIARPHRARAICTHAVSRRRRRPRAVAHRHAAERQRVRRRDRRLVRSSAAPRYRRWSPRAGRRRRGAVPRTRGRVADLTRRAAVGRRAAPRGRRRGEAARLARIRRAQRVTPIAAALAFARATPPIGSTDGPVPEAVRTTLEALAVEREPSAIGVRETLRDAQDAIRDGRLSGSDRERLIRLGERVLAYSIVTLVYAASLGDADADPTTIFDPAIGDRHTFGRQFGAAWEIAREDSGTGQPWHLTGSLLGLDVGLARFALRRLSMEPPSQAPRISSNDRRRSPKASRK
jgi:hypothetical protein